MVNNIKKHVDKPLEWYWNILQAVKDSSNSGSLAMYLQTQVPLSLSIVSQQFHFPFPKHIPHIPITQFFQIYFEELDKYKLFRENSFYMNLPREANYHLPILSGIPLV